MSRVYFKIGALILFSLVLLSGCSGEQKLLSIWTNQQIKIDGETSDWQNNLKYLKDDNVALGIKNDNNFLYICLTTNDFTKVFPMLRGGFIAWFEPENGGKTIGIKYPIHNTSNNNQVPNSSEEIYNRQNPGEFINRMLAKQNELQILNEDKLLLTDMPIKNNEGIEAKLGYNSDRFVYELKVPLSDSKYAYKLSAVPGEKLKIKFETEEPERKNLGKEREGGMRMSGGEEGERGEFGGERSEGGRRFGMRNGGRDSFAPLNFSVEVTLKKE
ncbi:MAG: hypothetical protein WAM24_04630 [Ignavibacteriaceae bacterium]